MIKSSNLLCILGGLLVLTSCGCSKKRVLPPVPPTDSTEVFQRYVKDQELRSQILHEYIKFSVFLPEDYASATNTRYPVVYMLHGLGDDHNSWNGNYLHANRKIEELEKLGLSKMIYVFPQGHASYYCNFYDGSYNYMDMFVKELIPLIDKQYRTLADKEHRAVTGYSMGGFGACALAEKHPEMFNACAPLSMSVRTDWQYLEESQSGWNKQWGIIFGGVGKSGEGRLTDYYKQHCPIHYFNPANKEKLSSVHWYLICGDNEENLLYANDELHCVLRDNDYQHEYRVVDGGHSSSVWMPALNEVLPFFDYHLNGNNLWNPDPGREYEPAETQAEEDGTWSSPKYKENKEGTGLFVVYDQTLPAEYLKYLFTNLQTKTDNGYVFLPCPLEGKDLAQWMAYWESQYKLTGRQVLGFGKGAAQALALPTDSFSRYYFINPEVDNTILVIKNQCIYFAGTDISSNYHGMNNLYNLCKKKDAQFEYRIVKGCSDPLWNILSSLDAIISQFIY